MIAVSVYVNTVRGVEIHPISGSYSPGKLEEKILEMAAIPSLDRIELSTW